MLKQGHLGSMEVFVLASIYQAWPFLFNFPAILSQNAATGAWLLNISIGLFSILMLLPICALLKRFPGRSIIGISQELVGKGGAMAITLFLAAVYLMMTILSSSVLASSVETTILPRTPMSAELGLIFVVGAIVSYLGLESLSRTALIFSPFILVGFLLIIVLAMPDLDLSGMYPVLGVPLARYPSSTVLLSPSAHELIFIGIIAPYLRNGKSPFSLLTWSIIVITAITSLLMLTIELTFPYPECSLVPYPVLQVTKLVHIGMFVERIEALFLILAMVASLLEFCTVFHTGVLTVAQGLGLSDWRPLIFAAVIIAYSLSFVPYSGREIVTFYYSPIYNFILATASTFVPFLLYLVALLRGRRGESNANA